MSRLNEWIIAASLIWSGCIGTAAEEEATSESLVIFNGGEKAIAQYGRKLTGNTALECSSATAVAGALPVLDLRTGNWLLLAGAAAKADEDAVTIPGGTASRVADGGIALGAGAGWNGTTLQYGGAMAGQLTVSMNASFPASVDEANALFDDAFGPAARGAASLSTRRGVLAWYATGDATLPGQDGAPYSYAFGIVRTEGGVLAVHTTAFGPYRSAIE